MSFSSITLNSVVFSFFLAVQNLACRCPLGQGPVSDLRVLWVQASELADLEDEANMPIEQLLARYGLAQPPGPSPHPNKPKSPTTIDPPPPQAAGQSTANSEKPPQNSGLPQETKAVKAKGMVDNPAASASASVSGQDSGADVAHGVADVKPEEQAEQAASAGMDAFEHSQALAERRASGSQAGPSAATALSVGKFVR